MNKRARSGAEGVKYRRWTYSQRSKRRVALYSPRLTFNEKGQAMAETAIFAILAVIMGFGLLTWIPLHRARTLATATAYACAQFLSQSPNPERAARNALQIAESTLESDWSAIIGMQYQINVRAGSPGGAGICTVGYQAPVLFRGLGFIGPEWSIEQYISRSETWKARWQ